MTPIVSVNLTLLPWPHSQIPGACIPKRANGSLPIIITPITNSLNIDRKEAMCLRKQKKKLDFSAIPRHGNIKQTKVFVLISSESLKDVIIIEIEVGLQFVLR